MDDKPSYAMKKGPSFFVVGFLAGALFASGVYAWLGRATSSPSGNRTLNVAHVLPTSHPVHRGLKFMAQRARELSGGRLRLEIFPSEQLGTEVQCLEQAQAGTLAITKVSAGAVGSFVSNYKVLGLPYLFRDTEHSWKVLDGEVGRELLDLLGTADDGKPSGLHGLCFYDAGSRNFYAKEPILTPQDLRGKKIRVMNDPVAVDLVRALGGAPTPIAWGELYTALQQRVVDGAENNPPSLLSSRHYEICRHFTLDHHTRIPDVLVISAQIWGRLAPQEKAWLEQAAAESSQFQRKLWADTSERTLTELRAAGVQIHEVDLAPFREAAQPVLQQYGRGKIGELVRRIQEVR